MGKTKSQKLHKKLGKGKSFAALLSFCAIYPTNSYCNNTLQVVPPNQTSSVVLTQTGTGGTSNSLEVEASGSIDTSAGLTAAILPTFDGINSNTSIGIQIDGGATPGLVRSGTGAAISAFVSGTLGTATLFVVNKGQIQSTGGVLLVPGQALLNQYVQIYNLGTPATNSPASITGSNFNMSGYGYLQLGVNPTAPAIATFPALIPYNASTLNLAPLPTTNTDGGSISGEIIAANLGIVYVQGNFSLTGGFNNTAGGFNPSLIVDTYAGSTGLQISSNVGQFHPIDSITVSNAGIVDIASGASVNCNVLSLAANSIATVPSVTVEGTLNVPSGANHMIQLIRGSLSFGGAAGTNITAPNLYFSSPGPSTLTIKSGAVSLNSQINSNTNGSGTLIVDAANGSGTASFTTSNTINAVRTIQAISGTFNVTQAITGISRDQFGNFTGFVPIAFSIGQPSTLAAVQLNAGGSTDSNTTTTIKGNGILAYNGGSTNGLVQGGSGSGATPTINVIGNGSTVTGGISNVPSINVNNTTGGAWTIASTVRGATSNFTVGTLATSASILLNSGGVIGISGIPTDSALTIGSNGLVQINGGTIFANITGSTLGGGPGSIVSVTAGDSTIGGSSGPAQTTSNLSQINISNTGGGTFTFRNNIVGIAGSPGDSPINMADGTVLALNGSTIYSNILGTGTPVINVIGGASSTFGAAIGTPSTITGVPYINVNNTGIGNFTISGTITGVNGVSGPLGNGFSIGTQNGQTATTTVAASGIIGISGTPTDSPITIGSNGTLEYNGGNIYANISGSSAGGGPGGTINVTAGSTVFGTITNVPTINVNNTSGGGGDFAIANAITGFTTFTTAVGTTTDLSSNLTGATPSTFTNAGAFNANSGGTLSFVTGSNAGTLTINNGGLVNVAANGSLNNSGTVNTNSGGTLSVAGGATLTNPGTIALAGALNVAAGGTLNNTNIFNVNSGGNLSVAGNATFSNSGTFTLNGGGSVTVDPGTTLTNSGTFFFTPNSALSVSTINNIGTFNLAGSTTFTFTGATPQFLNPGILNIVVAGNPPSPVITAPIISNTPNSGTINVQSSFTTGNIINGVPNIFINGAGTVFTVMNAITGATTFAVGANASTVINSGGSVINSSNFSIASGATTQVNAGGAISLISSGTLNINGGTLNMNGGSLVGNVNGNSIASSLLSVTGSYSTDGSITNVPTISLTGGNMSINNSITGFNNFNVDSTSTATVNSGTIAGTNFNNNGTVTLAGGNMTLSNPSGFLDNGTLTLAGGILNNPIISTNVNSILNINSSFVPSHNITNVGTINNNATTLVNAGISITGFSNFTNAGSLTLYGTITGTGASTFTDTGTLTLQSGSTLTTNSLVVNGTLNLNGGTFNAILSSTNPNSILNVNANYSTNQNINSIGNIFVNNGTLTVNNTISGFSRFVDNSVITLMPGGLITGNLNGGTNPNSTLNINTNYSTAGSITGIQFINVNGSTLAVNNAISGFNTFLIGNGSTPTTATINGSGSLSGSTVLINSSSTLNMAGGTLQGNITGNPNSTLLVSNNFSTMGSINGVSTINVTSGSTFTVQNPITAYSNFINAGTVNVNNGAAFGTIQGVNGTGTLNFNSNFSTTGSLGTGGNGGLQTINIASGTVLTLNNSVFANQFNNFGTLALSNAQSVSGNYVQTGTFNTTIQSVNQYGQLVVNGPGTVGGTINVSISEANSFNIPNGATFDVITTTGLTDNNPAVTYPASLFLTFVRDRGPGTSPNNVRIKAVRNTISSFANGNPSIQGVASALDVISTTTTNANLIALLESLEQSPNAAAVTANLTELIPEVNGMEIIPSLYAPYPLFDEVAKHLNSLRLGSNDLQSLDRGYMAGDLAGNNGSYGPIFFGNAIKQQPQDNLDGYTALTGGLAVVIDVPLSCYLKVGTGVSYSTTGVKTDTTGSSNFINSAQGLFYGCLDYYNYVFFDWAAGLAQNNYRTSRNIPFLAESANAQFTGVQATAKGRTGFNILINNFEATPLATLQYTRLNQRQYTEHGAPGANLTVLGNHVTAVEVGYGLKITEVSEPDRFLPEIHALFLKYLKNPSLAITSEFVAGGPAFISVGPQPPKTGGNVGGSISVKLTPYSLFMGTYDFEIRRKFTSHSVSFKFRMLF